MSCWRPIICQSPDGTGGSSVSDGKQNAGSENVDDSEMNQIHDFIQNMRRITREESLDAIFRGQEYMQKWFDENVDLEGYDVYDAFFEGFFKGADCVCRLYAGKNKSGKSEKKKSSK